MVFLPPATKLGQGSVFTRVCDSVHGGRVGLPHCMLGYTDSPQGPETGTPPPPNQRQAHPLPPPREDPPGPEELIRFKEIQQLPKYKPLKY